VIYEISPPISPALAVWPGDSPPSREVLLDMANGDNLTLSTLRTTVHAGAHADGPNHYGKDAAAIHERDLDYYIGPCQVVRVPAARGERVCKDDISDVVSAERVLIATGTYPDPTKFNTDFAAIDPYLIEWLQERGVRTIGIDTPSVDLFESKDLPTHQSILKHDMAILEGLVLTDVPPGKYELIALPLKLVGFDASPVRAILRPLD
jgi:arylformamidase